MIDDAARSHRTSAPLIAIGLAARRAGISTFRARWYADRGLLGPITRSEGKLRMLSAEQAQLLVEIARWRAAELSLQEIGALIGAHDGDTTELVAVILSGTRAVAVRLRALGVLAEGLSGR